jgi:nicotinamidase-related amidase
MSPLEIKKVDPKRTALLMIDMQNDFIAEGAPMETPAGRSIVPKLRELLTFCRNKGILVIYTAHVHRADKLDLGLLGEIWPPLGETLALVEGTPGAEIYPELTPREGEPLITKFAYDAFYGTKLDHILRINGIDTVIIAGVTTDNCCLSAARGALWRNYRVIFLSDGTATFDYPDIGMGAVSNAEVQRVVCTVIGVSTGGLMTIEALMAIV